MAILACRVYSGRGQREDAENPIMNPNRQVTLAGLLALLYGATLIAGSLVVGQPAPDFQATTLDGKKLTLADFKDQVLVINFWATWCVPCKQELPLLNSYFVIKQPYGLRVLAVTTENSAPVSQLRPLATQVKFPMVRYMKGPYEVMKGVPTNYVIDRHGILRYARAAAFDLADLNHILVPLLLEAPGAAPTGLIPVEPAQANQQSTQ
jgi:thiol-disulfide isomerase/thioredoxin